MHAEMPLFPEGEFPFDPDSDYLFQSDPLDPVVFPQDTLPFAPDAMDKAARDVADFIASSSESLWMMKPIQPRHLSDFMELARNWDEEVAMDDPDEEVGDMAMFGNQGGGYSFLQFLADEIDLARDRIAVRVDGMVVPSVKPMILLSKDQASVLEALFEVEIPTQNDDVKQLAEVTLLGDDDEPIAQVEVAIAHKKKFRLPQESNVVMTSAAVDLFEHVAPAGTYKIVITRIYSSLEDSVLIEEEDEEPPRRAKRRRGSGHPPSSSTQS